MGEFRYVGTAALIARGEAVLKRAVGVAAEDLAGKAMAETPVETGTLRASIHVDGPYGGAGGSVYARVQTGGEASDYAIFVHEGTGAHVIKPSNARALSYDGHFARLVHHPGTKAYKFIERPLIAEREVYLAFIAAAARQAF